jgi:hypothetical protein
MEKITTTFHTHFTAQLLNQKQLTVVLLAQSRYLIWLTLQAKYSSTNVFASDGMIYENTEVPSFTFTFMDQNDITDVIVNQVEPVLSSRGMQEFYYQNFTRPDLTSLTLNLESKYNQTTKQLVILSLLNGNPAPVGPQASQTTKNILHKED